MKIIAILFTILLTFQVKGQLNNDYKDIAKKKIQLAISYYAEEDGDTVFTRYYYDHKGRIVQIQKECWNKHIVTSTFDSAGNELAYINLDARINMDTVQNSLQKENCRRNIRYDTTDYRVTKLFPGTRKMSYMLSVFYSKGRAESAELMMASGDTSFFYETLSPYQFHLTGFSISQPVDTIKNGISTTTYEVRNNDTIYSSCGISVSDKHGGLGRLYAVEPMPSPTIIHKENGKLYTPIGQAGSKATLLYSYKNKYTKDGTVSESIMHDYLKNSTTKSEYPDGKKDDTYSLNKLISERGTKIILKYYNH